MTHDEIIDSNLKNRYGVKFCDSDQEIMYKVSLAD